MPLPEANQPWPPEPWGRAYAAFDTWGAWYSGDPAKLANAYGQRPALPANRPSQMRGGLVGTVARMFWGQPTPPGQQATKLHMPLPADIASTSADLLFSEAPAITVPDSDQATQARIDELADDGMHATLLETAEIAAAFGGAYLRVVWDRELDDRPILAVVNPDNAIPQFQWGRLTAVTFWWVVAEDGRQVWRHLERHEPGVIEHGLYEGTTKELGRPVPLGEAPATASLAPEVDRNGVVPAVPGSLTATYIPNIRPQRDWRDVRELSDLGRSDYAGVEPVFDALDETYTSWMRDVRIGKGRVIVPQGMLDTHGPGQGASVDLDREVFTPVNALVTPNQGGEFITPQQFAIRVVEHRDTAADLLTRAVESAGYSAQTFGEGGDAAITATEVHARERRSFITRGKKALYVRPRLAGIVETLLAVDAAVFGTGVTPQRPEVNLPDAVQEQPLTLAQTAKTMRDAEAASTETLVRLLHPDWDEDQITSEVNQINQETAAAQPQDPDTFRGQMADQLNQQ